MDRASTETATSSGNNVFSWIKDALFNKEISPSKKYLLNNNNYKQNNSHMDSSNFKSTNYHLRSNSLDGLTDSFYQRYDLLHDNENDLTNQYNLKSPINLHSKKNHTNDFLNDTFSQRNNNFHKTKKINYNSPRKGDPLLYKLFANNENNDFDDDDDNNISYSFPGKFPSTQNNIDRSRMLTQPIESVYDVLLNQLSTNTNSLHKLNDSIENQKNQLKLQENYYKKNYELIKNDYIISLKDSQKILDRSIQLTQTNRKLKSENEKLIYDNRNEKDFMLQELDILKNELRETKLIHKADSENLNQIIDRLQLENKNLIMENNSLKFDANIRHKNDIPHF